MTTIGHILDLIDPRWYIITYLILLGIYLYCEISLWYTKRKEARMSLEDWRKHYGIAEATVDPVAPQRTLENEKAIRTVFNRPNYVFVTYEFRAISGYFIYQKTWIDFRCTVRGDEQYLQVMDLKFTVPGKLAVMGALTGELYGELKEGLRTELIKKTNCQMISIQFVEGCGPDDKYIVGQK